MITPPVLLSWFFLYPTGLLWAVLADEVVVSINDTRLVTVPADLWNFSDPGQYEPDCGGKRFLGSAGDNVSLNFTGTGVTVNFLTFFTGRKARVTVDNEFVDSLDTYEADIFHTNCVVLPWTSDVLTLGQHTVTVTALDLNPSVNGTEGYVVLHNFIYEAPSAGTSGSASSTQCMSSKASIIGGAVAGVIGILLIFTGIFCLRRRWRALSHRWFGLGNSSVDEVKPTVSSQVDLSGPDEVIVHVPAMQEHVQPTATQIVSQSGVLLNLDPPSSTPAPGTQRDTNETPWEQLPSTRSQVRSLPQAPRGVPPPMTLRHESPTGRRLSEYELDIVQRLAERNNVPRSTLYTIIASMLNEGGENTGESELVASYLPVRPQHRTETDIPPGYTSRSGSEGK